MQRQATGNQAPQSGQTDATIPRGRDQSEPQEDASGNDATTLAFEGLIGISGDDDYGADPYNRTGRFKRTIR